MEPDFRARGATVNFDGVFPLKNDFTCPIQEFSQCEIMQTYGISLLIVGAISNLKMCSAPLK
ncbi:hypothetical protein [Paenibacillus sp. 22594]|uniref:hypothetical protein n=1 Tax=Paenibacillus sp. 22594 TaxID=3453947 RepID=UPI003F831864